MQFEIKEKLFSYSYLLLTINVNLFILMSKWGVSAPHVPSLIILLAILLLSRLDLELRWQVQSFRGFCACLFSFSYSYVLPPCKYILS